jgi:ATP-dependent Lon protease
MIGANTSIPRPDNDVLDMLADMPPREMRRALMTGFGNARLAHRDMLMPADLPRSASRKAAMGFIQ